MALREQTAGDTVKVKGTVYTIKEVTRTVAPGSPYAGQASFTLVNDADRSEWTARGKRVMHNSTLEPLTPAPRASEPAPAVGERPPAIDMADYVPVIALIELARRRYTSTGNASALAAVEKCSEQCVSGLLTPDDVRAILAEIDSDAGTPVYCRHDAGDIGCGLPECNGVPEGADLPTVPDSDDPVPGAIHAAVIAIWGADCAATVPVGQWSAWRQDRNVTRYTWQAAGYEFAILTYQATTATCRATLPHAAFYINGSRVSTGVQAWGKATPAMMRKLVWELHRAWLAYMDDQDAMASEPAPVHRAHAATSGPSCVAYANTGETPAGKCTFVDDDVTCPACLAGVTGEAANVVDVTPEGALTALSVIDPPYWPMGYIEDLEILGQGIVAAIKARDWHLAKSLTEQGKSSGYLVAGRLYFEDLQEMARATARRRSYERITHFRHPETAGPVCAPNGAPDGEWTHVTSVKMSVTCTDCHAWMIIPAALPEPATAAPEPAPVPVPEFSATVSDLADALKYTGKALPTSSTVRPVLQGALISADADTHTVTLTMCDGEHARSATVDAKVTVSGVALVSGALLTKIIDHLGEGQMIFASDGAGKVHARWNAFNVWLPTMPVEDFPAPTDLPPVVGSVDAQALSAIVARVAVATAGAADDDVPHWQGVHFTPGKDTLALAATDRYRLTLADVPFTPASESAEPFNVPAKELVSALKTFAREHSGQAGMIDLRAGGEWFAITAGRLTLAIRTLEADKHTHVRDVLRRTYPATAEVDGPALAKLVNLAHKVDRDVPVRLTWSAAAVRVSVAGFYDDVPCTYNGLEGFTLLVNPAYLTQGLTQVKSKTVAFGFDTSHAPVLISAPGATEYRYLVKPIGETGKPAVDAGNPQPTTTPETAVNATADEKEDTMPTTNTTTTEATPATEGTDAPATASAPLATVTTPKKRVRKSEPVPALNEELEKIANLAHAAIMEGLKGKPEAFEAARALVARGVAQEPAYQVRGKHSWDYLGSMITAAERKVASESAPAPAAVAPVESKPARPALEDKIIVGHVGGSERTRQEITEGTKAMLNGILGMQKPAKGGTRKSSSKRESAPAAVAPVVKPAAPASQESVTVPALLAGLDLSALPADVAAALIKAAATVESGVQKPAPASVAKPASTDTDAGEMVELALTLAPWVARPELGYRAKVKLVREELAKADIKARVTGPVDREFTITVARADRKRALAIVEDKVRLESKETATV